MFPEALRVVDDGFMWKRFERFDNSTWFLLEKIGR